MEPIFRADTQESLHSHVEFRSPSKFSCKCFPQTSNVHVPSMIYDNITCNHGYNNGIIQPAHEQVFSIPWTPTSEGRRTPLTEESKDQNHFEEYTSKKISIPALKAGSKNKIDTAKGIDMNTDSPRIQMVTRETKSNIMKVKVRLSERDIETPQFNTNFNIPRLNTGVSQRSSTGLSQRLDTGLSQRLNTGLSQRSNIALSHRPLTYGHIDGTLSQMPISIGRTSSQSEETKSTVTTLLRNAHMFSYTDPWDREVRTYKINYTGENRHNLMRSMSRTSNNN